MKQPENRDIIYDKNVIEFLTVGVEFCAILETDELLSRSEWTDRMLKILPLLYLKALLLPESGAMLDVQPEIFVKEEDYNRVMSRIAGVMGEEDIYLDVFMEEMKYSDRPISSTVSENIADIYQDIRNFVSIYQFELTVQMQSALTICIGNFYAFWGQKLVNVLRPLHSLKCIERDIDGGDILKREEMWD